MIPNFTLMDTISFFTVIVQNEVDGYQWKAQVYSIYFQNWTGDECKQQCINNNVGQCDFFVFQSGSCYLGNIGTTNGTAANNVSLIAWLYLTSGEIKK